MDPVSQSNASFFISMLPTFDHTKQKDVSAVGVASGWMVNGRDVRTVLHLAEPSSLGAFINTGLSRCEHLRESLPSSVLEPCLTPNLSRLSLESMRTLDCKAVNRTAISLSLPSVFYVEGNRDRYIMVILRTPQCGIMFMLAFSQIVNWVWV